MKVLLGAYACEPNKGSEPGIGWNWAVEIARLGHEVHVLTRANNRPAINAALASRDWPENLHFHYYDLKPWQRFWKRGTRGLYPYYFLWQLGAARMAAELHRSERFDLVHQLTFGGIRLPTFLWKLRAPLIIGPLGGGETTPRQLRRGHPFAGKLEDAIRDLSNTLIAFDPSVVAAFDRAEVILAKTGESRAALPARFQQKCEVRGDIGVRMPQSPADRGAHTGLRLLYLGRFVYWKGMRLGLRAFALAAKHDPSITLTMVGDGPERDAWKRLAIELGIDGKVVWHGWRPHDELEQLWQEHDILLFPSLRDSSGSVIFEAAAHGLPIVCFDLAGPGTIVTEQCGVKVDVRHVDENEAVGRLGNAIIGLHDDKSRLEGLKRSTARWAQTQRWPDKVRAVYAETGILAAAAHNSQRTGGGQ